MATDHARMTELRKQLSTLHFSSDGHAAVDEMSLFLGGVELRAEDRGKVLARAIAGEITSLDVKVTSYVQRPKTPNRKFVRVRPGAMGRMARSFEGMPALVNHDHADVASRGGTIVASELERRDTADGTEYAVRQTWRLVKQWAIVGVLDGTLDRMSVSFMRDGTAPVVCSVHETPIFEKCYCWPGSLDDKGNPVEWIYTEAVGLEGSFVNVPAVAWTSVDSVKELAKGLDTASLTGILGLDVAPSHPYPEKTMDPRILAALALAVSCSVEDALAAIAKLFGDVAQKSDELTIAQGQLATAREAGKIVPPMLIHVVNESIKPKVKLAANASFDDVISSINEKKVEESIAGLAAKGKLTLGGESEKALRSMSGRSMEQFDAQVADMLKSPSVTPAGAPAIPPGPAPSNVDEALSTSPEVRAYMKSAGITKEQFEKYGMPRLAALRSTD
jgi:hypothetical protein